MAARDIQEFQQIALRLRDVADVGLTPHGMTVAVATGAWTRLARGLYAPTVPADIPWQTLHQVQRYAPKAVFCLETALAFHDLSDVRPLAVWYSLARNMRRPKISWVATEVVTVAADLFELGVETHETDAGPLRVTGVARTLVDCFRFRRRLGMETAIAALRDARRTNRVNPSDLLELARSFRQERTMLPYVEAVG